MKHNFDLKISEENREFIDEEESGPEFNGFQYVFQFPNGYGASVIKHAYSYGWEEDLWELAVLDNGELTYDTPITGDVEGYLTDKEVDELLTQIRNLV